MKNSLSLDFSLSWIFPGAIVLGGDLEISQGEQLPNRGAPMGAVSSNHMQPESDSALKNNTAASTEPAGGIREADEVMNMTRTTTQESKSCSRAVTRERVPLGVRVRE